MSSESKTNNQWWLFKAGQTSGPFTSADLASRIASGRVTGETMACPVGGTQWHPLRHWPELFGGNPAFQPPLPRTVVDFTSPYLSPAPIESSWPTSAEQNKGARNSGELRHSGLGIAALITSVASGVMLFLLTVAAGALEASTPGGIDETSLAAVILGLFLIGFLFTSLIALGLAIAGCFQPDRKKLLAILGLLFSIFTIVGMISMILFGLAME